jgi:DNA-binding transcriptional regulator GbsR (MarR family)
MTPTKLSVSQLTLYNPSRLKDAEIVAAFVARQSLFERVLGDIAAEKPASRPQHHLLVGLRGMGKSMMLARLAAELRMNVELSKRFVPLVFAEEQYAVDRLSKFWLNCLDSLADAAERVGDTAASGRIDDLVRRLRLQPGGTAEKDETPARAALVAFLEAAKSSGKRPVLLVDNLQLVFERLAPIEQHALRELLMQSGSPILVGASPSPPLETQNYGAAFYDHFKIHYLRPLSADEMHAVMIKLAETTDRADVRDRVLAHPERLKTLRELTGGNPRTVVTLFFLYTEDFSPSVFADLENLLDRVTPLYKARIEELSEQQQVVISAVADYWAPITARTLSETTGLPLTSISGQLDRLEKTGFVEKVEIFGQTAAGYQIAERFFNVWFLMRSASRRQRREVEFLVRFIESFYEAKDRTRLAQHLMSEHNFSEALFAAYDQNWGICRAALTKALAAIGQQFSAYTAEDWFCASAVFLHLNYGEELLTFLRERGDDVRLRPWYEALSALHRGDRRYLQNIPVEVRTTAEYYFDQIEKRLNALPEKTRRWPAPNPVKSRRKT